MNFIFMQLKKREMEENRFSVKRRKKRKEKSAEPRKSESDCK